MSAKKKQENIPEEEVVKEEKTETAEAEAEVVEEIPTEKTDSRAENEKYLRLMAEYDNYRKRSAKERENIYTDVRVDTVTKFLPVYDNLERALATETSDEAYKKGVEMTFNQLKEVMTKLGVEEIPAVGEAFDPTYHNAVMHIEDEQYGEGIIVEQFQKGFKIGEKVIRFSMVKVAN